LATPASQLNETKPELSHGGVTVDAYANQKLATDFGIART